MPKKIDRKGEIFITNEGYKITVIAYREYSDCDIQFENGLILYNKRISRLKKGQIKNPYHPTVYDIGYFGESTDNNYKITKSYQTWYDMISRCYNKKSIYYIDCLVDERWHNFQNFAKWFEENNNSKIMIDWQLDKDILIKGNKIYSPETCCFVPMEINYAFTKSARSRGYLPIGVSKYNKDKFLSVININNKRLFLGSFETPEEAFKVYKKAKENYIKEIANKWKDKICIKVYEALYNYQVEITD